MSATEYPDDAVVSVQMGDSPSIDAFSRTRVSAPQHVFDVNFVYDLQPLQFEAVTAETGATVTHSSTDSHALMTFSSTPTGGKAYMQSYQQFRYQSGRSQLIFCTFNFRETMANTLKFVGYGDRSNGVFLEQDGTTVQMKIYSNTSEGNETVAKSAWNLDKLDGTGPSGLTLDLTKTHILVIDLQWLGVGRVRVGFDIGGSVVYVHEFNHANLISVPYMKTATLPVSAGMTCTGTVSTTMTFICTSVSSEGGEAQEDIDSVGFSHSTSLTAGSGARTHALSLRPKTTFNSIANRATILFDGLDVLVTGNYPLKVELCIGDVITGTTTFADVNATYSSMEVNTAGTTSGSPTVVLDTFYVSASAQNSGARGKDVIAKFPITLNAAGAVRSLGTVTVLVSGIGAASACQVAARWREVR